MSTTLRIEDDTYNNSSSKMDGTISTSTATATTTASTCHGPVPKSAAQWIVTCCDLVDGKRNYMGKEQLEGLLQTPMPGLNALNSTNLLIVFKELKRLDCYINQRDHHMSTHYKYCISKPRKRGMTKPVIIREILHFMYTDYPICLKPVWDVMNELEICKLRNIGKMCDGSIKSSFSIVPKIVSIPMTSNPTPVLNQKQTQRQQNQQQLTKNDVPLHDQVSVQSQSLKEATITRENEAAKKRPLPAFKDIKRQNHSTGLSYVNDMYHDDIYSMNEYDTDDSYLDDIVNAVDTNFLEYPTLAAPRAVHNDNEDIEDNDVVMQTTTVLRIPASNAASRKRAARKTLFESVQDGICGRNEKRTRIVDGTCEATTSLKNNPYTPLTSSHTSLNKTAMIPEQSCTVIGFSTPNTISAWATSTNPSSQSKHSFGNNSSAYNNNSNNSNTNNNQGTPGGNPNRQTGGGEGQKGQGTCRNFYVKREDTSYHADVDADALPRNPFEQDILSQLVAIGFLDKREILSSIRRIESIRGGISSATVDDVMCDIILQREEAEESRKMDEARILSEQSRKEESKRLRDQAAKAFELQLLNSSIEQWLSNDRMFSKSWILKGRVNSRLQELLKKSSKNSSCGSKAQLISLLMIEKKSQQWYGMHLPHWYFEKNVTDRLVEIPCLGSSWKAKFMERINHEVSVLNNAMFTLSEQVNGVPRIFRKAFDEHALLLQQKGRDDNDGNEVILITDSSSSAPSCKASSKKYASKSTKSITSSNMNNTAKRNFHSANVDIIEID